MGDMMIPFIMLLIVTIALVLERRFQEEKQLGKHYEICSKSSPARIPPLA